MLEKNFPSSPESADYSHQEDNKEREPALHITDKDILLEITQKCYTGCSWCYKCENVSSKSEHVSLELVKSRIDWIKANTNAQEIILLGGEPLLHPQFRDIAEYVMSQGFSLHLITSGKVAKKIESEVANLEYVLGLYEQGKIDIELSFQPGRNNQSYKKMSLELEQRATKRQEQLQLHKLQVQHWDVSQERTQRLAKIENKLRKPDVFSTVTLDATFAQDFQKFEAVFKFLLDECAHYDWQSISIGIKSIHDYVTEQFNSFALHFNPYENSAVYANAVSGHFRGANDTARFQYRIWGADRIIPVAWETLNELKFMTSAAEPAKGSASFEMVCPAMGSHTNADQRSVTISTPTIRTDGEVTFSTPKCISAKSGVCNTGIHQTPEQILDATSTALELIRQSVIDAKRASASNPLEFCKADILFPDSPEGHQLFCPSCPVTVTCNSCHTRQAPWQVKA